MFGLALFVLVSGFGVAWGLQSNQKVLQLPALMGFANLGYLLPQALVLWHIRSWTFAPHLDFFLLYAAVCTAVCMLGFFSFDFRKAPQVIASFSFERLALAGVFFVSAGVFGFIGLKVLAIVSPESLDAKRWTGLPVYVYSLSKFVVPGLTLLILASTKRKTWWTRLAIGLSLLVILNYVVFAGRRQWFFLLAYGVFMPLILQNRIRVGRLAVCAAVAISPMVFMFLPAYRHAVMKRGITDLPNAIASTPPSKVLRNMVEGENTIELEAAVMLVAASRSSGDHQWGTSIYNGFIMKLVPGSLVGRKLKENLLFPIKGYQRQVTRMFRSKGFIPNYTAKPSFHDAYTNFSWFGLILYFVLGRIFAKFSYLGFHTSDFRGVLFLSLLGFLPAALIYGAWDFIIPIFVPIMVVFYALTHLATRYPQLVYFLQSTPLPLGQRQAAPALMSNSGHPS